ncbi:hypothetical protein C8J57DRAFT_1211771 [Mycena rebaudengoi]|nr:hypothetical protein C8J57DRAFT_1211771 [Mycena rebaudengoi]
MPKALEAPSRGRYTPQACNICRARQVLRIALPGVGATDCDAGSQNATARNLLVAHAQPRVVCSWGRDSTPRRRPRTEAHFEALRKRTDALQAYDVSAHHQFRPPSEVEANGNNELPVDSEDTTAEQDDDEAQELFLWTQFLKANEKLATRECYGIATPARLPKNETSGSPEIVDNLDASYVLLIDGVDAATLRSELGLVAPPVQGQLGLLRILDLFLKFSAIFPLHVIPHLFLRDMYRALSSPASQSPPKTTNYSPMLHNAILAHATAFSDNPYIRGTTGEHFLAAAKGRLEAECQNPNTEGAVILGEAYCGMSIRIGQVPSGLITSDEIMGRNYAHWTSYTLDVYCALYFGREFVLLPVGRGTPMPLVTPEADQLPWHYAPANIPPQPNYLSLIFSSSTSLTLIALKIVQLLPFVNRSARSVKVSDQEIDHLKSDCCTSSSVPGTIFLLLSLQSALGIRVGIQSLKRSLSQAELCVQYLRDMGKSWKAAASTADILQGLIDTKLEPIITRRGVRLDVEELNSNPVSLATDGARAEALVPPDDPVPFTPSTSWHEPLDMDAIMNELPWPQAHWDFYDDPSSSNA